MFFESTIYPWISLNVLPTHAVNDMSSMFIRSSVPGTLNLSGFDTPNVTNRSRMFESSRIDKLDLKSFRTHNVRNMSDIFEKANARFIDLSSFDTSSVTNMSSMFESLITTSLDIRHFILRSTLHMQNLLKDINVKESLPVFEIDIAPKGILHRKDEIYHPDLMPEGLRDIWIIYIKTPLN